MLSLLVASGRSAGLLTVTSVPSLTMHLYTTVGAVVTRSRLYSRSRRSYKVQGDWRQSSGIWIKALLVVHYSSLHPQRGKTRGAGLLMLIW